MVPSTHTEMYYKEVSWIGFSVPLMYINDSLIPDHTLSVKYQVETHEIIVFVFSLTYKLSALQTFKIDPL